MMVNKTLAVDPARNAKVSNILKVVDRLVKAASLAEAMTQIGMARELDGRNMYVHAYEERIMKLMEEEQRSKKAGEVKDVPEGLSRKGAEDEEKRTREEETKRLAGSEHLQRNAAGLKVTGAKAKKDPNKHKHNLEGYKNALREVWRDGAATPEEGKHLAELRARIGISAEDHIVLEATVKRECYLHAFRHVWAEGTISPLGASTLAGLRKKFGISAQEFESIELELLEELRPYSTDGAVVVVDDDRSLLEALGGLLEESGYRVQPFLTSDEAFSFLRTSRPDIIISDVNLETSTMGGFAFFERVRELEHLQKVPFLFLSGITDEVLIRTGKAMGVDDYITKPFSNENLLSVIKGKLRRFRPLRLATAN